jgi:WD repeat-containing protein 7
VPNTALKLVPGSSTGIDIGTQCTSSVSTISLKQGCTASTLLLDLQRFTSESIAVAKKISTNRDQTRSILLTLERLRSVLSTLLTPGLNEDIDGICTARLGIQLSPKPFGFARYTRSSSSKNPR